MFGSKLKSSRQAVADLTMAVEAAKKSRAAIANAALAANRPLSDDERRSLTQLAASIDDLETKLKAAQRERDDAEAANERERTAEPITDPDREAGRRASARAGLPTGPAWTAPSTATGPRGARYADMFPGVALTAGGFDDAEQFFAAVASGRFDSRLQAATMHGTDDPHGGFAAPPEFAALMLDAAIEGELVRPRATIWPMESKTRTIPRFAASGGANDNGPFGVAAQWVDESGSEDLDQSVFTLEQQTLTAHSLALYVEAGNGLVADGLGFAAQLQRAMALSGAWQLDRAFLRGSGTGEPAGLLVSGARVIVEKESGQSAATINYANLTKMLSRLSPGSFGRAIWVAHTTTIPQLLGLSVPVGTGGSHVPAVVQANGTFTLLTRPLIFSEKVPALGSEGDIGLYDFSAYQIGMRADVAIDTSRDVGFRRNTTAFRLIVRVDGQPGIREPYTQPSGDTVSPFVVLAERA